MENQINSAEEWDNLNEAEKCKRTIMDFIFHFGVYPVNFLDKQFIDQLEATIEDVMDIPRKYMHFEIKEGSHIIGEVDLGLNKGKVKVDFGPEGHVQHYIPNCI